MSIRTNRPCPYERTLFFSSVLIFYSVHTLVCHRLNVLSTDLNALNKYFNILNQIG
ncbi:hypothetical protein HanRHA438_Chr15g0708551 [Helianthus annuus]|nr:hypothetical protein HanRHA438_Chr15g0708551 [Helianthus annuus]